MSDERTAHQNGVTPESPREDVPNRGAVGDAPISRKLRAGTKATDVVMAAAAVVAAAIGGWGAWYTYEQGEQQRKAASLEYVKSIKISTVDVDEIDYSDPPTNKLHVVGTITFSKQDAEELDRFGATLVLYPEINDGNIAKVVRLAIKTCEAISSEQSASGSAALKMPDNAGILTNSISETGDVTFEARYNGAMYHYEGLLCLVFHSALDGSAHHILYDVGVDFPNFADLPLYYGYDSNVVLNGVRVKAQVSAQTVYKLVSSD